MPLPPLAVPNKPYGFCGRYAPWLLRACNGGKAVSDFSTHGQQSRRPKSRHEQATCNHRGPCGIQVVSHTDSCHLPSLVSCGIQVVSHADSCRLPC